jgi:hypothetical protein
MIGLGVLGCWHRIGNDHCIGDGYCISDDHGISVESVLAMITF